jgi:hypothetical protein
VSHHKIGDVRRNQGDLAGALAAYEAALAIREELAASDPDNAGWRRDLSVSHNNIGDVRREQGDLAGALAAYEAALAIRKELAGGGPGQRRLAARSDRLARQARVRRRGPGTHRGGAPALRLGHSNRRRSRRDGPPVTRGRVDTGGAAGMARRAAGRLTALLPPGVC